MKKTISLLESKYFTQISLAKENGYEAVLIPHNDDCDLICLENAEDEEYMIEITYEFGWNSFLLINLKTNASKMIDLSELEAA